MASRSSIAGPASHWRVLGLAGGADLQRILLTLTGILPLAVLLLLCLLR
jgi:hypothetical protein